MKNKAARAMEEVLRLRNNGGDTSDYNPEMAKTSTASMASETPSEITDDSVPSLKKKIKKQDERIVKLRNDAQKYKTDLDKATKIIEREVGEGMSIDEILKDTSSWKGRAQKIEMLKTKIRQLKLDNGDSISTTTMNTEFTGIKSHAEKNLETMQSNRARELDKMKEELVELRDKYESLQQKYKGACARKVAVENEMKEMKSLLSSKFKVLIDKTENDDKLINALRVENQSLKSGKGAKMSTTTTAAKATSDDNLDRLYTIQNENAKLKNELIVLKSDLKKKENQVNELMMNCVGAPDEALEEKENYIMDLEDRVEQLERENFVIKNKNPESMTGRNNTESDKIIKDLSAQNAKMRLKIADLSEKVRDLEAQTA